MFQSFTFLPRGRFPSLQTLPTNLRKFLQLTVILLCLTGIVVPVYAAPFNWTGAAIPGPDGTFNVIGNWDNFPVPGLADVALFDLNATYTVTFDNSPTNIVAAILDGNVTLTEAAGPDRTYFLTGNFDVIGQVTIDDLDVSAGSSLTVGNNGTVLITGDTNFTANDGLFVGATSLGLTDGEVTVDGASGSAALNVFGEVLIGEGVAGTLRAVNGGNVNVTGGIGSFTIGDQANGDGVIEVGAGSIVQVDAPISIGTDVGVTSSGQVTVSGAGAVFDQIGLNGTSLGTSTDSTALIEINNGGTFSTGGGFSSINPTATVTVDNATLEAGGDIQVVGDLTLTNNALFDAQQEILFANNSFSVSSGSDVMAAGLINITTGNSSTNLLVDGPGTQVTTAQELLLEGVGASTTASLGITNGASVNATDVTLATISGSSNISVSGNGSTLSSATLTVNGVDAMVNIGFGGLVDVANQVNLLNDASLNLNGGELRVTDFDAFGSSGFNFNAGLYRVTQNATFDILSANPIQLGSTVQVDGQTTLIAPLAINGGRFATESLVGGGLLQLNTGTLAITGAGGLAIGAAGPLGPIVTIPSAAGVEVTNTLTVDANALFDLTGGTAQATQINNNGQIRLGGGASQLNASSINNTGLINGAGRITAPVSSSGRIEAFDLSEELVIVSAVTNQAAGFMAVRNSAVRLFAGLNNAGQVSVGDGASDLLGNIDNTGTIGLSSQSVASVVGDLVQNGTANLLNGSRLIVFDEFSGIGGTTGGGTLEVLGAFNPGNSPAEVTFGGDVLLAGSTETLIELGGLDIGEFDRIVVDGLTSLAGTLNVQLINSFSLGFGQQFEIIETNTLDGMFSGLDEGDLVGNFGGTDLFITYNAGDGNDVALFVEGLLGDFDFDNDVDGADFLTWQRGFGTIYNADDLADWEANYGSNAGLAYVSAVTVPEPTTGIILLFIALLVLPQRRCQ